MLKPRANSNECRKSGTMDSGFIECSDLSCLYANSESIGYTASYSIPTQRNTKATPNQ